MPDSIEKISAATFCESRLSGIRLSNKITEIEDDTFSCCPYIYRVDFSQSLKKIDEEAFTNCDYLDNPQFPNTLEFIKELA